MQRRCRLGLTWRRVAPSSWARTHRGRSLLALLVKGIPLTLTIGFLAGAIGLVIGTILGLLAGYVGGVTDVLIRSAADIMLTVPGLLVLIVYLASSIDGFVSARGHRPRGRVSLAWMWPTRTIRSQVLSMPRPALRRDGEAQRVKHVPRSSSGS